MFVPFVAESQGSQDAGVYYAKPQTCVRKSKFATYLMLY